MPFAQLAYDSRVDDKARCPYYEDGDHHWDILVRFRCSINRIHFGLCLEVTKHTGGMIHCMDWLFL